MMAKPHLCPNTEVRQTHLNLFIQFENYAPFYPLSPLPRKRVDVDFSQ